MPRRGNGDIDVRLARDLDRQLVDLSETPLDVAAQIVLGGMRRRIPRSQDGSHGRPPGYAASRLQIRRGRDVQGPYRDVGTDATTPDGTSYPAILEHGSQPHVIESHGNYPLRNPQTGQVFGRRVMHPGIRPMPWLRPALGDLRGRRL